MHYVLYRNTKAYGANAPCGFLKFFMPRIDEARPVLAPVLADDPLDVGVRAFPNMDAAVDFLEGLSAAVMTPRAENAAEDPYLGWIPLYVPDGSDRLARIGAAGLEEV